MEFIEKKQVKIIGAGLAGCEAAYRLLKAGVRVELCEMRPNTPTPAHKTGGFAELVCSNSLKSQDPLTAHGLLKAEMTAFDSLILKCAEVCRVPAGAALAVDRQSFSDKVECELSKFTNLTVKREEVTDIIEGDSVVMIAAGPLASGALCDSLKKLIGNEFLHFFDAAAPIISADSIDMSRAFFASRYDKGDAGDYLNCAMDKEQYMRFYDALISAEGVKVHGFEGDEVFEGCMPVEIMARRGIDALRFGPLKPVGLRDKEGKRPYAVVQLRKENEAGTLYNMVGFQTHLTFGEQRRVFSLIPGLENAEFLRFGVMHRNSFVNAPKVLKPTFELKTKEDVYIIGQLSGVEGYVESAMSGLIGAKNVINKMTGQAPFILPTTTVTGALCDYIANSPSANFQPMNGNFGILAPIDEKNKAKRKSAYAERAIGEINKSLDKEFL